ncbi:hypothetical protein EMCG_07399 [[Emmonsia] crescens]|uniref:Uncharacterized protein n=1 Tax=[Emmonsia] crescens TaxID=73230 RepID=A0A0G2I8T1_9EURO|nr:hypothetical protein EMCG_07399 [Emmonsia crescens UAMH 3008]
MALAITYSQNTWRARPCDEVTTGNVVLYPSYVDVASISSAPARGQSFLSREVWNISMATNRANQCHPKGQLTCCLLPQEMEIGTCHHEMKAKAYRQEYVRHFEKSEQVEELDDRLKLYGVKKKLICSARRGKYSTGDFGNLLELAHLYGGGN